MSAFKNLSLPTEQPLLGPVVVLNLWTLLVEAYMYSTRLPALAKVPKLTPNLKPSDFDKLLPAKVQWAAHNYNHLHEQPSSANAVMLALALLGVNDKVTVGLAYGYVGLRVVHSIVQITVNEIPVRFMIFASSSVALLGLTVRAAMEVFGQ